MKAKMLFDECGGIKEDTPLERLRFFCALAMNPQDWRDAEPFFDAVVKEMGELKRDAERYRWVLEYAEVAVFRSRATLEEQAELEAVIDAAMKGRA